MNKFWKEARDYILIILAVLIIRTFIVTPETVETNITGTKEVVYTVIDNAGNESSSGEITITNTNPSLTVTTSADNNYKTSNHFFC